VSKPNPDSALSQPGAESLAHTFLRAANAWLCDNYALDIRYLADVEGDDLIIWNASIGLAPLPSEFNYNLKVDVNQFVIGQIQFPRVRKSQLMKVLTDAMGGKIEIEGRTAKLITEAPLAFQSEMAQRDRWFAELHVQVFGKPRPPPSNIDLAAIDNSLRVSDPPFDGLADAAAWLTLSAPGATSFPPSINIRVSPPIDIIIPECKLSGDELNLTLQAVPKFDVARAGLAVRATPGVALDSRMQVSDQIKWSRVRNGRRTGILKVKLKSADNALAMLSIEGSTVRRQWFIDSAKARNNRFLAVQLFDKDLRMIKQAVLESSESSKFENGVAALLFLLGFTPCVQIETDAPDLIVTTPGGKLAIVECTTRISDFATKVGKLVDRRGALSKQLSDSRHAAQIAAVLICRLPKNQIAARATELRSHEIILLTRDDLINGFDSVRIPADADMMLEAAMTQLSRVPVTGAR
jgi:hypothetical protein